MKQSDGIVSEQSDGPGPYGVTHVGRGGIAGPTGQSFASVEPGGHVPPSASGAHEGHPWVGGWMQYRSKHGWPLHVKDEDPSVEVCRSDEVSVDASGVEASPSDAVVPPHAATASARINERMQPDKQQACPSRTHLPAEFVA